MADQLEVGVIVRLGDAPLIIARIRDRRVVRQAVGIALAAAERRVGAPDPVAAHSARQEVRMLRHLLAQVGGFGVDTPGAPSGSVM